MIITQTRRKVEIVGPLNAYNPHRQPYQFEIDSACGENMGGFFFDNIAGLPDCEISSSQRGWWVTDMMSPLGDPFSGFDRNQAGGNRNMG